MPQLVVMGAQAKCSFGTLPASLTLVPNMVNGTNMTVATIQDFSVTNLPTFGMCSAPTNPAVVAASGSPVPCVPVIVAPWSPGSAKTKVKNKPALTADSKCMCSYLGVVEITNAGQTKVTTG